MIKSLFSKHIEEWRLMENSLNDDTLWYFLSNESVEPESRMSLIMDIVSRKPLCCTDDEFSFKYFQKEIGEGCHPDYLWRKIQHVYRTLWNWSLNPEIYHKVGYLICANYPQSVLPTLTLLYYGTRGLEHVALNEFLDKLIAESQSSNFPEFLERYRHQINISFYRTQTMGMGTFPFDKYKTIWRDGGISPPVPDLGQEVLP